MSAAEEFTEFAVGAAPRLRRTAFLLCGDYRDRHGDRRGADRRRGPPTAIGIAPDGKTAYVACLGTPRHPGTVVPISTATNKAGTPIEIPVGPWRR